jgi:hypothetical protein
MRRLVLLCAVLNLLSTPLFAQTVPDVQNPRSVEFTASPDHALIDSYELDILRPDGTVLQTLNIGKPVPDSTNVCNAPVNVQPVAFATGYSMRLRARAGTAVSTDTVSVNKFDRVPGPPSRLTAK